MLKQEKIKRIHKKREPRVLFTCLQCSKTKYVTPHVAKIKKYCSYECKYAAGMSDKARKNMRENHADFSGKNHPGYGSKRSKESKEKSRQSQLKRFKENPFLEETKEKLRRSLKGKNAGKNNPMYGVVSPMKGQKHTEEVKEKNRQKALEQFKDGYPEETREKNRIASTGKKNGMYGRTDDTCPGWKGDDASSDAMHSWVKKHLGKASEHKCVGDGINSCDRQAHHWSNVDHTYKRNLDDYQPRCGSCHVIYDNKFNKIA